MAFSGFAGLFDWNFFFGRMTSLRFYNVYQRLNVFNILVSSVSLSFPLFLIRIFFSETPCLIPWPPTLPRIRLPPPTCLRAHLATSHFLRASGPIHPRSRVVLLSSRPLHVEMDPWRLYAKAAPPSRATLHAVATRRGGLASPAMLSCRSQPLAQPSPATNTRG